MIKAPTLLFCLLAVALPAQAEMYKYVDEQGRVTYSNKPIKGGRKVELPEISTVPAPKADTSKLLPPPPSERDKQRKALQDQIAQEEKALAAARQAHKEGAEKPEVWQRKNAEGQVVAQGRNVAAYEEKMKRLQEEVEMHEKNLEKLKAELAALDKPSTVTVPTPGTSEAN